MSDEGLYRLYKLHQIDANLYALKSRGAALDVGQKEAAAFKKLQSESKDVRAKAKALRDQLTELQNRKVENILTAEKHEKTLYDGTITNPKELQDLTRDVKERKEQDGKIGRQIAELTPQVEEAEAKAATSQDYMAKLKEVVLKKQEKAKVKHAELEARYHEIKAHRAEVEKLVDPRILREYDSARRKTGNTGMATISDASRCEVCGIDIPEKTYQNVRDGKVEPCQSCRRILFIVVPES